MDTNVIIDSLKLHFSDRLNLTITLCFVIFTIVLMETFRSKTESKESNSKQARNSRKKQDDNKNNEIISSINPVDSECPFGFKSSKRSAKEMYETFKRTQGRIITLYEIYIHFPQLLAIWESPVTDHPRMEPYFAASCHSMEIAFLLISEFIKDPRKYIMKRPRIEMICKDLVTQCHLLADLLDGELEDTSFDGGDDDKSISISKPSSPSKSSYHPNTPPLTETNSNIDISPGLTLFAINLEASLKSCSKEEDISLRKLVRNIISAFQENFTSWPVGLGIEHQINKLADIIGLNEKNRVFVHPHSLDYALLVRPQIVADTLLKENYVHAEDFFFRSIHLGSECWAFIAVSRLNAAKDYAKPQRWYQAAIQIRYAANIMNYLGDHVLMLTQMVVRDYLELKVELTGTSGEGSLSVKSIRSIVWSLMDPLYESLLNISPGKATKEDEALFKDYLTIIYEYPDKFPCLYEYCKAMECIESALLGGFYYKHYMLAANVIGTKTRGTGTTTNKSIDELLQHTYSQPCFPILNEIRGELGSIIDKKFSHNDAKIMDKIVEDNSHKFVNFTKSVRNEKNYDGVYTVDDSLIPTIMEKCRVAEIAVL